MNDTLLWMLLHADHHHHFAVSAPFLIGIFASVLHVVSGPDHLAAVTPLAIDNKLKAWIIGLGWGLGHTAGMLLIGVLFIFFKNVLPIEAISEYGEFAVGLILIAIGVWALWRIFGRKHLHLHEHPHTHSNEEGESYTHIHTHDHSAQNVHVHEHKVPVKQSFFSAIAIGTIHGLAGVSHLLGILPTLAFPTVADSSFYLIGFGLGTVVAMIAFSFLLGFVSFQSSERFKPVIFKSIQVAGAMASLIVGVYWVSLSF
jgi:ABC-type nickel/cobalt efflux system permease component RcnA